MEEDPARPVTVLPVVREGKTVGLVRMHDILQVSEMSKNSLLRKPFF